MGAIFFKLDEIPLSSNRKGRQNKLLDKISLSDSDIVIVSHLACLYWILAYVFLLLSPYLSTVECWQISLTL